MTLRDERCEVCRPGMPALDRAAIDELRTEIDDAWEVAGSGDKLRRRVDTTDFGASMALAVRIGFLAETDGHHPDLGVHWGRLVITLTTHAAKGLTRNDFILAAKIDEVLASV